MYFLRTKIYLQGFLFLFQTFGLISDAWEYFAHGALEYIYNNSTD